MKVQIIIIVFLTVHGELPVVLDGGVLDLGVLGPARDRAAVVAGLRYEFECRLGYVAVLNNLQHFRKSFSASYEYETACEEREKVAQKTCLRSHDHERMFPELLHR